MYHIHSPSSLSLVDSSSSSLTSIVKISAKSSLSLVILLSLLFNRFVISEDRLTPRGVPLSRSALYDPQKDFSCLDGSKLIPFSFVNDDYCDCPDGSDEPGTSACSKGSFYCLNAGFVSMNIRSSRVNDQICDCCDGTDEFSSGTKCENTCDEMGKAAREELERKTRLAREGYQKRLEMSAQGKATRKTKEEERSRLEIDLQQVEAAKEEKLKLKNEAEEPEKVALEKHRAIEEEKRKREDDEEKQSATEEAENMFNLMDSNEDGILTKDEIKTRQMFDRNKDGEVSDEEALFFLNMENEITKEEFIKSGWILFKPYFLMEQGMFKPPSKSDDQGQEQQQQQETNVPNDQVPAEPTSQDTPVTESPVDNGQVDYEDDELEDNKDPDLAGHHDEEEEEEDEDSKDNHGAIKNDLYDEATRSLIEAADKAREEFQEAERVARDVSKKLQEVNDALNMDVGDDDRFAPLLGQCFEYTDREYTYSWCPFNNANQRGSGGGSEVHLGKWGSWSGPEGDKYLSQLYDRGHSCWNGPTRSMKVLIQCGIENKILSVTEPSRCEYQMEFSTPAACKKTESPHDEL